MGWNRCKRTMWSSTIVTLQPCYVEIKHALNAETAVICEKRHTSHVKTHCGLSLLVSTMNLGPNAWGLQKLTCMSSRSGSEPAYRALELQSVLRLVLCLTYISATSHKPCNITPAVVDDFFVLFKHFGIAVHLCRGLRLSMRQLCRAGV